MLQVGGMVLLWLQLSYRFLHWAYSEMDQGLKGNRRSSSSSPTPIPGTGAPS